MLVLITYDVNVQSESGQRRLRQVAKICVNYGQRVQNSVFECALDPAQFVNIKSELAAVIDAKRDSLRFYKLGKHWENRVETLGKSEAYHPTRDPFVF